MKNFQKIDLELLNYDLVAETTESGRTYLTPAGNRYPSVTTVLGSLNKQAIQAWRDKIGHDQAQKISNLAATRGTKLHAICESYVSNQLSDLKYRTLMPNIKELFSQLKPILDENLGNIYAIEQALYSDELKVAGRVDLIAEWNGILSIIDFKTSSKPKRENWIENYFLQCTTYAIAVNERANIFPEQIVVAIAVEGNDPQIFVKETKNYLDRTREVMYNYQRNLK